MALPEMFEQMARMPGVTGNVGDKLMDFNGGLQWVNKEQWLAHILSNKELLENTLKLVWEYGISYPNPSGILLAVK